MKETKQEYVKRTQRDYPMPFKMAVVQEVERTGIGVCAVARKYVDGSDEANVSFKSAAHVS